MLDERGVASIIPQGDLAIFLPRVLPLLEKTIEERAWHTWDLVQLTEDLHAGRLQLWAAQKGEDMLFVVTQLVMEPRGRSVQIVLGGGTLDDDKKMLEHLSLIEAWANGMGAASLVVWGRLGWKRLLAPQGYYPETTSFRKYFKERMQ